MPSVWWCNQTRCWSDEYCAGYIAASTADGALRYRGMLLDASPGDIVLHYRSRPIFGLVAVSRLRSVPVTGQVPFRGRACWQKGGRAHWAKAEYHEFGKPIPKSLLLRVRQHLQGRDMPLVAGDSIRQGYFMKCSLQALAAIKKLTPGIWPAWA